ncbi:MAG: hypothetical protein QM490_06045 [Candidatus Gracilibacteria bacterium]
MKLTICGSSTFRNEMLEYREKLGKLGHEGIVHPDYEALVKGLKPKLAHKIEHEHSEAKKENGYIKWYYDAIFNSDGILVLNFDKKGISNYIGGNTLMEIGFAHVNNKKVFLLNDVPNVSYKDEILAMYDNILGGDLTNIN